MASSMIVSPPSPRDLPDESDRGYENEDELQLECRRIPEADAESWVDGYKMLQAHHLYFCFFAALFGFLT